MESYYRITSGNTDKTSDKYIAVNNFGYNKHVDTTLTMKRDKGRKDYQIIYIHKGYGDFLAGDKIIRTGAGNIVVMYPGEKQLYEFPQESNTDYYWIHFTGTGVPELMQNLQLAHGIYKADGLHTLIDTMDKMAQACAIEDFTTEAFLSASMLTILAVIAKKIYISDSPIQKIIEQMQKEKFNTHSNSEYAELCGMSEYHFIRKFKQLTGTTPLKYKTRLVINKSIELMTTTNLNISETAYMLGFEDSLYFSRLFKKETGVSPQKYRTQHN